ncbi:bifunctional phosphopantothenoylcysteine decarboxylase/phosphopantothenate--cysteine ligase CoaBC [Methylovirgula sp. HY1]|uniref:bifunctional phosphopantothenoylcysteine decarboxylase/phosphopantothenate--cysteine ligase CoaBC n=1 Tax=Methylovirgula sp. HY1 TaxID=2822761 RepID=UPI001C5AF424|nr:bifunctional phosphopantothenoylcysteine decarboxylase/phosphopantothenate--cysteine ligase CoaBC [Methylovirgula sp. HY1]QXX75710.1 Coenzyme A biosynthesis bifunctional protein CoaBC [Methylovirgula sp. HY1]
MALTGKRILIIIGGGIAAYKVLDLIRRLRERGASLRIVMTAAAKEFVTPLSVASLAGGKVFDDLFSLTDETEIGHIQLSRDADLLVVAPATADLLAKMAQGLANELASTLLLATDKKILVAPSMNLRMWLHPATRRNMAVLHRDGVLVVGPDEGDMACGEYGPGRMSEPPAILAAIEAALQGETRIALPLRSRSQETDGPLAGRRVVVTSGPTHEPLDPVRYIANRSSGKQGHALAAAAAAAGAEVVLISGPVTLPDPVGIATKHVETAAEMAAAVEAALPADIFIAAAAVADWRAAEAAPDKIKKSTDGAPVLQLVENPDILATVAQHSEKRPRIVVGFAAETTDVLAHAKAKLARKGCDVIVANDVSSAADVMGGDENQVTIVTKAGVEALPRLHKYAVAERLVARFAAMFKAMLKDGSDA